MKPRGRHPHHALSAVTVNSAKAPGRYADGNGLYLVVEETGNKRWILRTVVQGTRTDLGLGGLSLVSLKDARAEAARQRKIARDGGDPRAERRARDAIPTFEQAARSVHTEYSPTWKNPKHAAQWINTLTEYAFPIIGKKRVSDIDSPDVRRVLLPIWLKKPETARRVKQRVSTVLDWAKSEGHRSGDNPVEAVVLPDQPKNGGHHAALPYIKVAEFIEQLHGANISESIKLAFEFMILTAARTGEVIGAKPGEIDGDTWTIPADRMKAEREHRVPLAGRCAEIVRRARELGGEFLFPGRTKDKPLSNMAFLMALRRMGVDTTAHGFRSSFRDWASEQTNYPRDVCEMALAHSIKDKTEAAYRRGDLFEKRGRLMAEWARYCGTVQKKGDVVPMRGSKTAARR